MRITLYIQIFSVLFYRKYFSVEDRKPAVKLTFFNTFYHTTLSSICIRIILVFKIPTLSSGIFVGQLKKMSQIHSILRGILKTLHTVVCRTKRKIFIFVIIFDTHTRKIILSFGRVNRAFVNPSSVVLKRHSSLYFFKKYLLQATCFGKQFESDKPEFVWEQQKDSDNFEYQMLVNL